MTKRRFYPSLQAYLDATGKTQEKLAEELGISTAQVSKYVRGLNLPRPELAVKIHEHTGVSLEAMIRARAEVA